MRKCISYDNIVVATVALTTLGTCPILIPNMSAIWHIFSTDFRAKWFGGASLRNIILFQCTQSEVRMTSPADLRQTHILAWFARFNCIQTLFRILCLIRTNIAFHGSTCEWVNWMVLMRQSESNGNFFWYNLHEEKRIINRMMLRIAFTLSIVAIVLFQRNIYEIRQNVIKTIRMRDFCMWHTYCLATN